MFNYIGCSQYCPVNPGLQLEQESEVKLLLAHFTQLLYGSHSGISPSVL